MARQEYELQISYKGTTYRETYRYSEFLKASHEFLMCMDHAGVNGLRLYRGSRLLAELDREYFKEMEDA